MTAHHIADDAWRGRSRGWHPSLSVGEASLVVVVGVKAVDSISTCASNYAQRIPAASRLAVHAAIRGDGDIIAAWQAAMPALPLEVVTGDDPVMSLESVIRAEIDRPEAREVIVLLGRRRATQTSGAALLRLVSALRRIDGVVPIVLPPPPPPAPTLRTR